MRKPRRSLATMGAALVLGGAAIAAAASLGDDDGRGWEPGPERPVSEGAGDLADISAHNSPTVVRSPRDASDLAVAGRVDSPDFSCSLHISVDRGDTWRRTGVPLPTGERKCYAADAAFAADGTLHVSFVTLRGAGNVPNAVWVARSRDGGRTLAPPVRVAGPRAFQVRIAADPRRAGRLHLTWLQASEVGPLRFTRTGNPIVATHTDDGGTTWAPPRRVSSPARPRVLAPAPAVGPRGELYVLFLDVGDDRLDYHGGHDGLGGPPYPGRHTLVLARAAGPRFRWEESVVDDGVRPAERFVAFIPPFPSLAVDLRSGRVFAALHDRRRGEADVWVWALDPGAGAWRGPVRVDDGGADGSTQSLPRLAVGGDGRLDAVFLDRRGDPRDRRAAVALQSSFDAGRTFGPRLQLSESGFDTRIGFGSERGMPDPGSRIGLVSGDREALAVWSDTRSGTDASNKQDLLSRRARLTGRGQVRDVTRSAGFALLAGGLAAFAYAAHGRRAARRH